MNKTVNINLAGIFFHIDEDAYAKLQHYLEAIKRSLTNTQGKEEIIADIEARIAELFNEKIQDKKQVIGNTEVEAVIATMGQPEDYMLDEEIFEDEPSYTKSSSTGKQLFRDTENSYVGGVSSGLGHYLGIQALWVRLLWVVLTVASSGAFILIYIALWIFVPEAKSTADKLSMRGEEVNISNIERKIKEGFDDVAGKVRNADYDKYGRQVKSGASSAATGISSAILAILNIFVKFIGLLILLIAGSTLIALFIGLFTVGTFGIVEAPWTDYIEMAAIGAPIWVISLLTFFAVGIPFFFLFILGLKIMVRKLKSIGTLAKMVLLGLWLLSVFGLAFLGVKQATLRAFDGEIVITEKLPISPQDTLYLAMRSNPEYSSNTWRKGLEIKYDDNDTKIMYITDIVVVVKSTKDSIGKIEIIKTAEGSDYKDAKDRAKNISYNTSLEGNKLYLDSYLTSHLNKYYRDQEVKVTVYVPEGSVLFVDENVSDYYRYSDYAGGILKYDQEEHFVKVIENATICETCPIESFESNDNSWNSDDNWDESDSFNEDDEINVRINSDGVQINKKKDNWEESSNFSDDDNVKVRIISDGVQINKNNDKKIKIDENGIEIKKN
ncbi:phage shock protein C (PspC) family protein [Gillisia mitskevichiae]|uniref:Phage shock protein C (PspC) family protein n=1 Tax=Gillisia mitskevichiae TaxID=270921 RepID=A0A495PS39_9FLAO|nr:PspC domain-containing protein [Gillisia mitskevichiae]RKS53361.1 phage shock protein C (PspC) family protein [Gillisia mitskevichiae]